MLNQQPPSFHPIFSTWLTWETVPLILAGPSCVLALSLVLIVLGQVASGQRGLRALTFCLVVGGFTAAPGILAWQRVMALVWGPSGASLGTEGDQFGFMGAAAALADQVPSYGLVLAPLASVLCALLLLGSPEKPLQGALRNRMCGCSQPKARCTSAGPASRQPGGGSWPWKARY